jgi:hypothetical protein
LCIFVVPEKNSVPNLSGFLLLDDQLLQPLAIHPIVPAMAPMHIRQIPQFLDMVKNV